MALLKSYFSMYINHKILNTKYVDILHRRRSPKKIFIGKGELKHTSTKIIITFYVYNTEKISLKREYKRLYNAFIPKFSIIQTTYYNTCYYILVSFIDILTDYLEVLLRYYKYLNNLVNIKILNNDEKFMIFANRANSFYACNYPKYSYYKDIAEEKYKEDLYTLRYLLKFNSVKFEKPFIIGLTHLVEKLYNKKIEFNIVNLRKMHLNSDILTQVIVLKLKNRKNRFLKILRSSLNKVKLPNVSRLGEGEKFSKDNKEDYFINKIRNTYINEMFNDDITKIDPLNKLLLNFFPTSVYNKADKLEINTNSSNDKKSVSLRNYVFKYLKHFKLAGVRLEAKGRVSRRFTASRSVFKLYWKGGLKNVDSSFKGLSTVMLRGDAKSNVQYSMLKSKYRIGAFGIKGWVSSK